MEILKDKNGDIYISVSTNWVDRSSEKEKTMRVLSLRDGKLIFKKTHLMEKLNEVRIRYTDKFFLSSNLREDFFLDMNGFWVTKKRQDKIIFISHEKIIIITPIKLTDYRLLSENIIDVRKKLKDHYTKIDDFILKSKNEHTTNNNR